jgi:hypothetical protein
MKNILLNFIYRYAKYTELEKNVLTNEEDVLIQKVLTNRSTKRKQSSDDDENESLSDVITTEIEPESLPIDENDLKWAANYIEEQQTQLILSLFNDNGEKLVINDNDDDDDNEQQNKEDDYKSFRPSLQTMGLGKLTSILISYISY